VPDGYRRVQWYDPWTGETVGAPAGIKTAGGKRYIDIIAFPKTADPKNQLLDGLDVAFKLLRR
jgi:hypothetical protein